MFEKTYFNESVAAAAEGSAIASAWSLCVSNVLGELEADLRRTIDPAHAAAAPAWSWSDMNYAGRIRGLCFPSVLLLLLIACVVPEPIVAQQHGPPAREMLRRVAILPFSAGPAIVESAEERGVAEIQALVVEHLRSRNLSVIDVTEFGAALADRNEDAPYDVRVAAGVASEQFEATALLVGHVVRYRERVGNTRMSSQPASVAFELVLRRTPTGAILWRGRFDETQRPLTEGPARASRLPGGGLRWITATQLATWGVEETVNAMLGGP
ncbi:MAG: hypothetical protein V3R91_00660 [Myxococcota bacterium]